MGPMAIIHRLLLKRGRLNDLLPDYDDLEGDKPDREAAKADIEARVAEDEEVRKEVWVAVRRLQELNRKNHYGESLRRAFGGR
jgi:hypothetical protein